MGGWVGGWVGGWIKRQYVRVVGDGANGLAVVLESFVGHGGQVHIEPHHPPVVRRDEDVVTCLSGWVGGWVDELHRKVEENEAPNMRCCVLGLGRWVGGLPDG